MSGRKLAKQLEQIIENDRRWFQRHPKRRWRIRAAMPGEVPNTQVLVRDFEKVRMRFQLDASIPPGLTDRGIDLFVKTNVSPQQVRTLESIEAICRAKARAEGASRGRSRRSRRGRVHEQRRDQPVGG